MQQLVLSKSQARKIILHAAALVKTAPFGKGVEAVYKLIDHLGYVQIDANYVVERAHHHVIASRVPGYKKQWLEELQADGRIYEFFTADSGFMPMREFRFSLPVKQGFLANRKSLTQAEINLMDKTLDRVAREGPLTVKDFDNDREVASSGWWDWRPSKIALERLYMDGRLMVTRTQDFQKLYDLPVNILLPDIDITEPTPEAFARHIIRRCLTCMGIAYAKEISWRARFVKNNLIKQELKKMVEEGEVQQVSVEELPKATLYMLPVYARKKITLSEDVFILSPFDILNVFRHRLKDFFDFDYQIECFVPEPKRKYGYFSLPVLQGDRFIARMDSKADRKKKILIIHNLHFEQKDLTGTTIDNFITALKNFAAFNQCEKITISKCNNSKYLKVINAVL